MTIATHTELMNIAMQAAEYINSLNGECDTFQIDGETLSAVIIYNADVIGSNGNYWTAPSWRIGKESITVEGVYITRMEITIPRPPNDLQNNLIKHIEL